MAYHYNTRARARRDIEPDDISSGDLDVDATIAIVSESAIVGSRVESVEGLESQPTEVAGSVTSHPQLLPEGGHSSVGGHGSLGSVSSSFMGVTLGYPSGHPDPHSSMIARDIESQSTASSAATDTTSTTTGLLARQPPVDIETAAATNPTLIQSLSANSHTYYYLVFHHPLSFIPGLKPPVLQILPTAALPFSSSGFTTWILKTVYFYF